MDGELSLALEVRGEKGRTDLELRVGDALFIVEAKRGWLMPSVAQLEQYAHRIAHRGVGALLTLSQASQALAATSLPAQVDGVPVVHLPWTDVLSDIDAVQLDCRGHERMWLDELRTYLKGVVRVRDIADSWTYCVVLDDEKPGGGATFKEIVVEQLMYFHPYGQGGWPTERPNFMAFRWDGAVRRIHRVVKADAINPPARALPVYDYEEESVCSATTRCIRPSVHELPPYDPIPNGAPYRATRLWVLLDQLQTAPGLAEAIANTRNSTRARELL